MVGSLGSGKEMAKGNKRNEGANGVPRLPVGSVGSGSHVPRTTDFPARSELTGFEVTFRASIGVCPIQVNEKQPNRELRHHPYKHPQICLEM
jgi:hypothetical protein